MGPIMALRVHGGRDGLETILAQQEHGRVFHGFDDQSSVGDLGDDVVLYFAEEPPANER